MARQVIELLEDINNSGTTIVMVTHDAELARRAHRNVHIMDGEAIDIENVLNVPNKASQTETAMA
jgi:putative ABC transport system ATP-binding protein